MVFLSISGACDKGIKRLTLKKSKKGVGQKKKKKEGTQETDSAAATVAAAINKGCSARSVNTPAALCANLIFSK